MDLVTLSSTVQDTQTASKISDSIIKFIMQMSAYQTMRLHHMLTLDVCRMVAEELPTGNTTIDRKALVITILNAVYTLTTVEQATIARDVDIFLATSAIMRTPFFKRTLFNCVNFVKKKFL